METDTKASRRRGKVRRGGWRERLRRDGLQIEKACEEVREPCHIDVASLEQSLVAHGLQVEHPAKVSTEQAVQQTAEVDSEGADAQCNAASSTADRSAVLPSSLSLKSSCRTTIDGTGRESVPCTFNAMEVAHAPIRYADRLRCIGHARLQQTSAWQTSGSKVSRGTPNTALLSSDALSPKPCWSSLQPLCADSGKVADALQEKFAYLNAELELAVQELDAILSRADSIATMSSFVANLSCLTDRNVSKRTIQADLDMKLKRCLLSSHGIQLCLKSSAEALSGESRRQSSQEGSSDVLTFP